MVKRRIIQIFILMLFTITGCKVKSVEEAQGEYRLLTESGLAISNDINYSKVTINNLKNKLSTGEDLNYLGILVYPETNKLEKLTCGDSNKKNEGEGIAENNGFINLKISNKAIKNGELIPRISIHTKTKPSSVFIYPVEKCNNNYYAVSTGLIKIIGGQQKIEIHNNKTKKIRIAIQNKMDEDMTGLIIKSSEIKNILFKHDFGVIDKIDESHWIYLFGKKISKGNGDLIYIELKNPIKNVEIAPLITNEYEMVLTEEPSVEETIMPEVEYYTSEEEIN